MRTRAAVLEQCGLERPFAAAAGLAVTEVELDGPGPRELLVRIAAAGVCHSDLSVVDGSRPRPTPLALGHEAAGVVEAAGAGVGDVRPGDRVVLTFVPACGACAECASGRPAVCVPGGLANAEGRLLGGGRRISRHGRELHHHLGVSAFAERAVVARESAVVVPPDLPFEVAALFGCAVLTGVGAVLHTAGVRPGESVAVFGLGGVGLSVVMGAALAGAYPVLAVDPVAAKRELALELGATAVLTPDEAEGGVRNVTGGGARHAFEAAGSARVLEAAYRATRRGGTTVAIGLPHPDAELRLPAVSLAGEARTLVGSYLGSAAPQRDVPTLVELWRAGRLPVERLVSGTLPLERLGAAFDALADGEVVRQLVTPSA